jgi:hypothetical protein
VAARWCVGDDVAVMTFPCYGVNDAVAVVLCDTMV